MASIKTKLAGIGLALGLLAIPLGAGAETIADPQDRYASHRYFFSEEQVWRAQDEPIARYAMLDMTELEQIAGRENLDSATIKFLEDNVWEYDTVAFPEGSPDFDREHLDQAAIKFLEDNIWDYQPVAEFADVDGDAAVHDPSRCNGEGFVDPANQIIAGIQSGFVARYCDGRAYAAGGPDDYESSAGMYDNMYDATVPREAWDLTSWLDQVEPMAGGVIDPHIVRDPVGDKQRVGVYGIDIGFYSDEIPWQDYVEPVGVFAGVDVSERPVLPFDEPQLRAEEPR